MEVTGSADCHWTVNIIGKHIFQEKSSRLDNAGLSRLDHAGLSRLDHAGPTGRFIVE